jgi:acetylornithine/N-succinyldiaminopimelate aminotransferase
MTVSWSDAWQSSLMNNYGTPPLELVRGKGSRVWDSEGVEYIDLIAGIAVNAVGHAHPQLTEAVTAQMSTLGHTSNLVATGPVIELAGRLLELLDSPMQGRVFFCNSGAEANEAAFKLARLTGRTHMVVAQGSFHGRTMGALALTAQPAKQEPFRPLPGDVTSVPFGDASALAAAVTDGTAAIVLEPIQGEGGVIVPPAGYLAEARAIADRHGALLILDEVQTGMGRTGTWFAHQYDGVTPDVVTLAKGLGGGLPIGACIALGSAADLFQPGSHGSTFGGNPVCSAAALAVIRILEEGDLVARTSRIHDRLSDDLVRVSGGVVSHVRGRGLLMACVLDGVAASDLERECRNHGLLVNAVASNAVRMAPALTITDEDLDEVMVRWAGACAAVKEQMS